MNGADDVTILRNMLLGRWAAEKLGLKGQDADAYARTLAADTLDPESRDVFSKIRRDFDAARLVQSDDQILGVMTELMLRAGNQLATRRGGSIEAAAAVTLARRLTSQ
jgi:hypothetical protein